MLLFLTRVTRVEKEVGSTSFKTRVTAGIDELQEADPGAHTARQEERPRESRAPQRRK